MTFDIRFLLLGLLLLWFPRQWMRRGVAFLRRRRRSAESARITEPWKDREPGDPRLSFLVEFTKFRNYVDLLRGGAGSLVLSGGMGISAAITTLPQAPRLAVWELIGVRAVVLMIGVLIQTVRYEKNRLSFYPPIFYLAGLSVGLCDVRGAIFAFVLIWAINAALPNAQGFLTVYALLMVVFGHYFAGGGDLSAAYAGILCFTPVMLSLLSKRPLMAFTRKSTQLTHP
jgi:hypothetical protein